MIELQEQFKKPLPAPPPVAKSTRIKSTKQEPVRWIREVSDLQVEPEWQEYSTEDGQRYWYNTKLKISTWENPEEEAQPLVADNDWEEAFSHDGRKYWYNKRTKVSQSHPNK